MSKPNSSGTGARFADFYAACAEHQAECSQAVRGVLIGSAVVLAIVAFLMRALIAHPLTPFTADQVGNAAFIGFDPMVAPIAADDASPQPVDATAIVSGMFMALAILTGITRSLAFLV